MELLKDIEAQGERQLHELLEGARRQVQSLLQAGQARARAEVEALERQWRSELDRQCSQLINAAQAKAQQRLLQAKSNWAQRLVEQLELEARQLRNQPGLYARFLERLLRETEAALPGPLHLEVDPADQACVQSLLQGKAHRIAKPLQTLGGFVAHNEAGDVIVDNRLETRLAKLQHELRVELGRISFEDGGVPRP